jgi:hypothetical protein
MSVLTIEGIVEQGVVRLKADIRIFNNRLYAGTTNFTNGGQFWLYLPEQLHLPLTFR